MDALGRNEAAGSLKVMALRWHAGEMAKLQRSGAPNPQEAMAHLRATMDHGETCGFPECPASLGFGRRG